MSSRCTNDGAYNLIVTFSLTRTDMASSVQNRVSLAFRPVAGSERSINVKKMSPTRDDREPDLTG